MIDRFQINYFEVDCVSLCAICKTSFNQFIDLDSQYFNCPKCGRTFKILIRFKALNKQDLIKIRNKSEYSEYTEGPKLM